MMLNFTGIPAIAGSCALACGVGGCVYYWNDIVNLISNRYDSFLVSADVTSSSGSKTLNDIEGEFPNLKITKHFSCQLGNKEIKIYGNYCDIYKLDVTHKDNPTKDGKFMDLKRIKFEHTVVNNTSDLSNGKIFKLTINSKIFPSLKIGKDTVELLDKNTNAKLVTLTLVAKIEENLETNNKLILAKNISVTGSATTTNYKCSFGASKDKFSCEIYAFTTPQEEAKKLNFSAISKVSALSSITKDKYFIVKFTETSKVKELSEVTDKNIIFASENEANTSNSAQFSVFAQMSGKCETTDATNNSVYVLADV